MQRKKSSLLLLAVAALFGLPSLAHAGLAVGTQITLADGSKKPIENVSNRMQVNDHAGRAVAVNKILRGPAGKMFLIKDGNGHQLILSGNQPVITPKGPIMAKRLSEGDSVLTLRGPSKIDHMEHIAYKGDIRDLSLVPTKESHAVVGGTFFANSILVGDQQMQDHYAALWNRPKPILSQLPKEWHQDYLNYARRER